MEVQHTIPSIKLPLGSQHVVTYSHTQTPNTHFYFNLKKNLMEINELAQKMNNFYSTPPLSLAIEDKSKLKVGEIYAARPSIWIQWYRVRLVNIKSNEMQFVCLDYGSPCFVSKLQNIMVLAPEFRILEKQAIETHILDPQNILRDDADLVFRIILDTKYEKTITVQECHEETYMVSLKLSLPYVVDDDGCDLQDLIQRKKKTAELNMERSHDFNHDDSEAHPTTTAKLVSEKTREITTPITEDKENITDGFSLSYSQESNIDKKEGNHMISTQKSGFQSNGGQLFQGSGSTQSDFFGVFNEMTYQHASKLVIRKTTGISTSISPRKGIHAGCFCPFDTSKPDTSESYDASQDPEKYKHESNNVAQSAIFQSMGNAVQDGGQCSVNAQSNVLSISRYQSGIHEYQGGDLLPNVSEKNQYLEEIGDIGMAMKPKSIANAVLNDSHVSQYSGNAQSDFLSALDEINYSDAISDHKEGKYLGEVGEQMFENPKVRLYMEHNDSLEQSKSERCGEWVNAAITGNFNKTQLYQNNISIETSPIKLANIFGNFEPGENPKMSSASPANYTPAIVDPAFGQFHHEKSRTYSLSLAKCIRPTVDPADIPYTSGNFDPGENPKISPVSLANCTPATVEPTRHVFRFGEIHQNEKPKTSSILTLDPGENPKLSSASLASDTPAIVDPKFVQFHHEKSRTSSLSLAKSTRATVDPAAIPYSPGKFDPEKKLVPPKSLANCTPDPTLYPSAFGELDAYEKSKTPPPKQIITPVLPTPSYKASISNFLPPVQMVDSSYYENIKRGVLGGRTSEGSWCSDGVKNSPKDVSSKLDVGDAFAWFVGAPPS